MNVRPRYTPSVSLGSLIQIAVLLIGIIGGAVAVEYRGRLTAERVDEMRTVASELMVRVRALEQAKARDDERFTSILQFMSRIDARLERIENNR